MTSIMNLASKWITLAAVAALAVAASAVRAQDAASGGTATTASAPATEPTSEPATEPASGPASEPATQATTEPATQPAVPKLVTSQPVAGDGPLTLNFRDAALRTVLEYISEAAGLIVVEDAKIDGRVTVVSRQRISIDEAVSLLDTVLKGKGFAAIRNGKTLKIVTVEQAKTELVPVQSGNDPSKINAGDRIITQIVPIAYADAVKLKTDLAALVPSTANVTSNASSNTLIITGTASTARRLVEIIQAIDTHMSEVASVKVFQLKYANASSAAKLISDIFKDDQGGANANSPFGGGRGRAFVFGPQGMQPAPDEGTRNTKVVASADDRTNTLVVSAAPDVMKIIEGVVKDLDSNPAEVQGVFSYRVKNGNASNMAATLNSTFGTGSGSSSSSTNNTGTLSSRFGNSSNSSGAGINNRTGTGGSSSSSSSGMRGLSTGATGSGSNGGRTTGGGFTGGNTYGGGGARSLSQATVANSSDLIGQVFVVADADTNTLLVTTSSKNFERVRAIIAELDRAVPQVLIKVLIAEVSHDNSIDLGVEFSGMNLNAQGGGFKVGSDLGVAAKLPPGGFVFSLNETYVTAAIKAIANVSKVDVLSRPYILTSDNQEASVLVGQSVPFVTYTQTLDTGAINNTIQYQDIGISLDVTPHINPQGLVTLDVYPQISALTDSTVPISETLKAPIFTKRFAQSRVAIRDGHSIVIGGLMEDRNTKSVDKVPLLGDIPGLGILFQHTVEKKTKTELLIFLTPHVAQQPDDLVQMTEDEKAGTKAVQNAVEPGAYQEHLRGLERGASTRPSGADAPSVEAVPDTMPSGATDANQP